MAGGRVSDTGGRPVVGANLQSVVLSRLDSCAPTGGVDNDTKSSDERGNYRLVFGSGGADEDGCGYIRVTPPSGSNLKEAVVGPLRFALRFEEPIDSFRVDIVLHPNSPE